MRTASRLECLRRTSLTIPMERNLSRLSRSRSQRWRPTRDSSRYFVICILQVSLFFGTVLHSSHVEEAVHAAARQESEILSNQGFLMQRASHRTLFYALVHAADFTRGKSILHQSSILYMGYQLLNVCAQGLSVLKMGAATLRREDAGCRREDEEINRRAGCDE